MEGTMGLHKKGHLKARAKKDQRHAAKTFQTLEQIRSLNRNGAYDEAIGHIQSASAIESRMARKSLNLALGGKYEDFTDAA